jgi:hypothetical protein
MFIDYFWNVSASTRGWGPEFSEELHEECEHGRCGMAGPEEGANCGGIAGSTDSFCCKIIKLTLHTIMLDVL